MKVPCSCVYVHISVRGALLLCVKCNVCESGRDLWRPSGHVILPVLVWCWSASPSVSISSKVLFPQYTPFLLQDIQQCKQLLWIHLILEEIRLFSLFCLQTSMFFLFIWRKLPSLGYWGLLVWTVHCVILREPLTFLHTWFLSPCEPHREESPPTLNSALLVAYVFTRFLPTSLQTYIWQSLGVTRSIELCLSNSMASFCS